MIMRAMAFMPSMNVKSFCHFFSLKYAPDYGTPNSSGSTVTIQRHSVFIYLREWFVFQP